MAALELLSGHAGRLAWPVMHVFWMLRMVDADARSEGDVRRAARGTVPVLQPKHQILVMLSTLPRAAMAAALLYLHFPLEEARELRAGWALWVLARDLVLAVVVAGGWDWIFYFSPLQARLAKYKLNAQYPPPQQLWHDVRYTLATMACGAAIEILVLHAWASGAWPYISSFWAAPLATACWVLSMKHWRHTHFYFMHRGIHPWRTTNIPDLGRVLYQRVHKEHHKSPNPTSWSGISMHPVEGTLYFTAALIPVLFGAHPIVFATCKLDLWLGAMIGHDGFGFPGGGGSFHYLHHENYEINYGEPTVPLDWFFGTYGTGPTASKDY